LKRGIITFDDLAGGKRLVYIFSVFQIRSNLLCVSGMWVFCGLRAFGNGWVVVVGGFMVGRWQTDCGLSVDN
jgi:hypothetical protein